MFYDRLVDIALLVRFLGDYLDNECEIMCSAGTLLPWEWLKILTVAFRDTDDSTSPVVYDGFKSLFWYDEKTPLFG